MKVKATCAALLALALILLLGATGEAQLPKQGTYSGKFGWSGSGTGHQIEKNHVFFVGEFDGAFFNDAGSGFLHGSSWVCPGVNDIVNGVTQAAHGYCIVTDPDGDKAFGSWKSKGSAPGRGSGDYTWTGGTSKYSGITGGGTFDYFFIATTFQGYSTLRGEYRLPY